MQNNQQSNFEAEPIAPNEVLGLKEIQIPSVVFQIFNEMIVENIGSGKRAVLYQDEIVNRLTDQGLNKSDIYKKNWLDVEPIYREKGWKVEYDKPGYNETYRAHFIFSS